MMNIVQRKHLIQPFKCALNQLQQRSFGHRVNMILRQDVPNVGITGQEITVKAGYARNYLYPKKFAVYATEPNRLKYKIEGLEIEGQNENDNDRLRIIQRLNESTLNYVRKSSNQKKFSDAITIEVISESIRKQLGILVGMDRILLKHPIKTLGTHKVQINVNENIYEKTQEISQDDDTIQKDNNSSNPTEEKKETLDSKTDDKDTQQITIQSIKEHATLKIEIKEKMN